METTNRTQFKQIITFFSAKGGAGQTLISSNVACLAAQKHPTLFIQLTNSPDAHTVFNIDSEKNFTHIIDFLENKEDIFQTFQTLTYQKNNMAILLSPMEASQADGVTSSHISLLLSTALQLFTTIVIDLGKEFEQSEVILKQSDKIVTVSNLDPQSIVRTNLLCDTLEKNFPNVGLNLVVNQMPPEIGKKEAEKYFTKQITHTLPYDLESVWDNVAFATPYSLTKSKLSKETGELLNQLLA